MAVTAPMTSHELAAELDYTRHANMRAAIRHVALKHGFDVKSMDAYSHTDDLNRSYKQYVVPPALCELVIKYSRELHQRRARGGLPGRVPAAAPSNQPTQVFTLADEVIATLNRVPGETLRLSRIAIRFSCTEAEAAKKLAAAVKQKRIKCVGNIYAANIYSFPKNNRCE